MTGRSPKADIEQAVGRLVRLPLQTARRIVDLQAFVFGEVTESSARQPGAVAEYRLHVQCRWRIVRDATILVGSADIFWPPSASSLDYHDFDYDGVDSRRDELVDAFIAHGAASHHVDRVEGALTGDLRLTLTDGCVIELWPDHRSGREANGPAEHWRFFRQDAPSHFVITAHGVGYDHEGGERRAD